MSTKPSQNEPKVVDQKGFLEFLQGLHLQALRLRRLKVDADRDFAHGDMKNVRHRERYGYEVSDGGLLRVDAEHEVRLVGARGKTLGLVTATFSWYYTTTTALDDKLFELYAPMVRFQTWPHLRELVQSVAHRANWPRITLPLLVVHKSADG